jgi:hypothetical protein
MNASVKRGPDIWAKGNKQNKIDVKTINLLIFFSFVKSII